MLSRYVPRLLTKQLLAGSGSELSSEDFPGVLLAVDIVDSTGITDRFATEGTGGAERLQELLSQYFGGVIDIVEAYGGDTIRIDGDAVIVLWRQDREPRETIEQAAAAAIAVQREFRD